MATAIEYGLIAALIAVVVITAVTAIGSRPEPAGRQSAPPQCKFQGLSWPAENFGSGWVCRLSDARWKP